MWRGILEFLPSQDVVRIRLMSKEFDAMLRPLVTSVTVPRSITQASLEAMGRLYPNLTKLVLNLDLDVDGDRPAFNLSRVCFPKLRYLDVENCQLQTLHFTAENMPSLTTLTIRNKVMLKTDAFKLSLPELQDVFIANLMVRHLAISCQFG